MVQSSALHGHICHVLQDTLRDPVTSSFVLSMPSRRCHRLRGPQLICRRPFGQGEAIAGLIANTLPSSLWAIGDPMNTSYAISSARLPGSLAATGGGAVSSGFRAMEGGAAARIGARHGYGCSIALMAALGLAIVILTAPGRRVNTRAPG